MNVMEAFDQSIVKEEATPTTIKMEAAEHPFESTNTVADSGIIVKRDKLSPIRMVSMKINHNFDDYYHVELMKTVLYIGIVNE